MQRYWKSLISLVIVLTFFVMAGCDGKEAGPEFKTAQIFNEYGKVVDTVKYYLEGDLSGQSLTKLEIKSGSVRKSDSIYTELIAGFEMGLPAFCDVTGTCSVIPVGDSLVIYVMDWDGVYYIVPGDSEDAARATFEQFMGDLAESMGIGEE